MSASLEVQLESQTHEDHNDDVGNERERDVHSANVQVSVVDPPTTTLARADQNEAAPRLTIRDMNMDDIDRVIDYFLTADEEAVNTMGIDREKLPDRTTWRELLRVDLERPLHDKQFFYVIWELDGVAVGHSNINKIAHGDFAFMHLHIWRQSWRKRGVGTAFVRASIRRYFTLFNLKCLHCSPNAFNEAPNRTLARVGFQFVKKEETIPGWINTLQTVSHWTLSREEWQVRERDSENSHSLMEEKVA